MRQRQSPGLRIQRSLARSRKLSQTRQRPPAQGRALALYVVSKSWTYCTDTRAFQIEVLRAIAGRARGRTASCAVCVPDALAAGFFGGLRCGRPCLGRRDSVHRLGRQFFDLSSESWDRAHRVFHEVR